MNNIKTAFDKLLEEDQEYFEFVDNESLCTTCKLEIDDQNFNSVAVKQEKSIHFDENIYSHSLDDIDNCKELQKATRSLSRISLEQNDLKLTDDITNLEQTNHQVIINDNNDAVIVDNPLFNYSPSFVCTGVDKALTILEQNLEDSNVKKTRAVTSQKNDPLHKNDPAVVNDKKLFLSDKETQTDLANGSSQQDNLWVDNEFLSDKELEKIDLLVNEHSNGDVNKNNHNKRKCDAGVENSAKKIKLGAREWNKDDWDSIMSDILKREKKCLDCSNDLFEYSEYLNETRKAFIRKIPSTNIKIPTPPVLVGYDNQFDFKNGKRYGQLPIQKIKIDNNNSSKLNGVNGIQSSTNTKSKIYP
ncbi:GSCOCG00008918001-RA-CDS [Cotesia congregata]|nr:GSCOCG00008918001-RA-CDS [Cotesia congregata]